MVNSMSSYSGLSEGLWGETMLTTCYLLTRDPNKRNKTTPYELWYKKRPNLSYFRVWGCRAVVRLPVPKQKTLGEKGIHCIFVGYDEHSKAYRPKDIIPNMQESQIDDHTDDIPNEIPEPRKDEDARTYNEAMKSQDAVFWKEAIDDEIGSIMENNTWVISDLPPGCKPLGCKWIFKRKMKVDETIDKFKARLVIQGFRKKEGIDYFDTYAPVARITTIRLLLALAAIHNLVIHQMDVKTAFLNGDLDEEVCMKQPEGFVMTGNEHKVCKLVKSLYGFKQEPKKWHQKFDEEFLSSKFSMKDMGEADVILGIKNKRENKRIFITQSHYIEKILKKFNREYCSLVSTPMDPVEKLKPNTGKHVDQLEYSRAIGCLMYGITSTRPDIAYAVGRLKGYSDASWINLVEDSSSTSGWVFLLGGAKWLRNLIHEILIWPKPIPPISIRCDSAPTMARAYSQIYNGKYRHLGLRHSMVKELIRNGVISIEFVRTQHNLADHLTKGLARDLGLRRNQVGDYVVNVLAYSLRRNQRVEILYTESEIITRFKELSRIITHTPNSLTIEVRFQSEGHHQTRLRGGMKGVSSSLSVMRFPKLLPPSPVTTSEQSSEKDPGMIVVLWIKGKRTYDWANEHKCKAVPAHISLGIVRLLQKCPTTTWMLCKYLEAHKGYHPKGKQCCQELAKDKIEAEKAPHFEDHAPPHIIRPKVFVTIQLCADVLTIALATTLSEISRRSSLESYDHFSFLAVASVFIGHMLRFLSLGTTKAVEQPETASDAIENEDSLASWTPFLLVHLHGQDNITTCTSEYNELWLGHLFDLKQELVGLTEFAFTVQQHVKWIENIEKRVFTGSSRSRVLNIQNQDKVVKSPRACHGKERKKTSLTVPYDLIGPAHNPFYGLGSPS
uniref:Zinc finger, CCHC-type n=1 Tax=Tanacetum cinerariifolium TaxID=118510 RepID=A0A6L2NDF4_TANCI|nr:zinc finger, CCHC-type [Tanacetum cinerariifolium]